MSSTIPLILGLIIGIILTLIYVHLGQIRQLKTAHQLQLAELQQQFQQQIEQARKQSLNTSRAVLKGKVAEQFAPLLPQFPYLPSDAKFLGDPIDYVIFSGYSDFREGLIHADDIEIILMDIKSGKARLHKGQQAIAQAIAQGRVRFETLRIDE